MICPKCGSDDFVGADRSWWMYLIRGAACYRCDDCDHRIMTRGRLAPRQIEDDDWDEEDENIEGLGEQDEPIEIAGDLTEPDTVAEPVAAAEPAPAAPESPSLSAEEQPENIASLFDERIMEAQNMVKKMKKSQPVSRSEAQDV